MLLDVHVDLAAVVADVGHQADWEAGFTHHAHMLVKLCDLEDA